MRVNGVAIDQYEILQSMVVPFHMDQYTSPEILATFSSTAMCK